MLTGKLVFRDFFFLKTLCPVLSLQSPLKDLSKETFPCVGILKNIQSSILIF